MNIPCILIPALIGLICAILGYLLGRMNCNTDDSLATTLQAELDACQINTKNLNKRIAALEAELAARTIITTSAQSFTAPTNPLLLFEAELARAVMGEKIKENDLTIVEGIGPKIEVLFKNAGISTWHELSEASTEKLQSILDEGGENYAIHNPGTWPKQALLAYEGKWQELKDLQDNLRAGKE
ncbi:hypothetical protein GJU43_17860 [Flavobacterium sp. LC2016-23]|uniref:hypothetical protein n=1 Tax=Flavobacterium sp. LC2016-23 TaxID=2666330 RepID=UPI0012AFAB94|nr:hypothetical protein [Flavobacterium sp. LC2016-23]MRX41155.1 hypothetical protein [Flavobacterium sp. LC2016-23]